MKLEMVGGQEPLYAWEELPHTFVKSEHSSWEVPHSKQHVGISYKLLFKRKSSSHTPPQISYLSHMYRFISQEQRQKLVIPSRRDNVCYVQLQHTGRNALFFPPFLLLC